MTTITRISTYNPKLANATKRLLLTNPFELYKTELQRVVDILLYQDDIPTFLPTEFTKQIKFPARLSQVLAKQASSIVRSIHSKINKANKSTNKKKYQKELLNKFNDKTLNIEINNFSIELDSRFIDIQLNKTTSLCDHWIKIRMFNTKTFFIPMKLTNHMKDLISRGFQLKINSLRINNNGTIGLYFYKEQKLKTSIKSISIDIGRNKLIVDNNNNQETTHITGLKIKELLELIKKRKSNSKQFNRTRKQIKDQINYSLKHDIDWDNIDQLFIEKLTDIKRNKKWGKKNQHWCVGYLLNKIEQLSEENDVRLTQVNAAYTSQICSICDFVDKNSRNYQGFLCTNCGIMMDADHNAAINIYNRGINRSFDSKCRSAIING
jgi:transposase